MPAERPRPPSADELAGRRLYGNDLTGADLAAWNRAEAQASFALEAARDGGDPGLAYDPAYPYPALYRRIGALLADRSWPQVLALGCADGSDIETFGIAIGHLHAIEPAREWWRDRVAGAPATYRAPQADGRTDLPDGTVDLALCVNVLHHVARVEDTLAELARLLRPGGRLLVHEPIASMGDFRKARPGLTPMERGIPQALLRGFVARAGLHPVREELHCTPGLPEALMRLRLAGEDSGWLVRLDAAVSRAMAFNARYWRDRLWHRIAPRRVTLIARKA